MYVCMYVFMCSRRVTVLRENFARLLMFARTATKFKILASRLSKIDNLAILSN